MNWFDTALIVVVCFLILTDLTEVLLKTKSFLQFQIAHNKAHTPTRICLTVFESILTDLTKVLLSFV